METLEAADLEKQKHNNTRMEVFSRLAGLEVLQNVYIVCRLFKINFNVCYLISGAR